MKKFIFIMIIFGVYNGVFASTLKKKPCIELDILKKMIKNNKDVTQVNTECITDMSYLFRNNKIFNQNISKWDTSNVIDMRGMFNNASKFNQNIGNWDVSNVTNMQGMFSLAINFNQDIGNWDVSNVIDMRYMFYRTTLFKVNYDALLRGWSQQNLHSYISFNAGNSKYSKSSKIFKEKLVNKFYWKITDKGLCLTPSKKQKKAQNLQSKVVSQSNTIGKKVSSVTKTKINNTLVKEKLKTFKTKNSVVSPITNSIKSIKPVVKEKLEIKKKSIIKNPTSIVQKKKELHTLKRHKQKKESKNSK